MLRRSAISLWGGSGVVLFALIAGGGFYGRGNAAEPTQEPSPLADAVELQKPITLSEAKIPLGELLEKVAEATGARLEALPEVADEPVAVVVKEMTARHLLEQIAALLGYQWSRRGQPDEWRYEIHQDLASKNREGALRQAAQADVERRLQQEVKGLLDMLALPPERIDAMVDEGEEWERKVRHLPPEQARAASCTAQGREQNRRMRHALTLSSPIGRAMATLIARLTPAEWATLRSGEALHLSSDPRPRELPLAADIAPTFASSKPYVYPPNRKAYPDHPQSEEELRQGEKRMQDHWSGAAAYRVTIRLRPNPYQHKTGGSLELSMEAAPVRDGSPQAHLADTPRLMLGAGPGEPARPTAEAERQRRTAMEKDRVLGGRKPLKPEAKPDPIDPSLNYRPWTKLQGLLPDLARAYGVDFIADSYWNSPSVFLDQFAREGAAPLFAQLDRLAGATHEWDARGRLIRLRSRSWFFDRRREVPLRLVRRWRQLLDERAVLPLEEYVAMATTLTDEQLEGMAVLVARDEGKWPGDLSVAHRARHALRLYGSLGEGQRQALWRGAAVPVAEMLPAQRALFLAGLRELSRFSSPPPDLSRWEEGTLALTVQRWMRIRERSGDRITSTRVEPADSGAGASRGAAADGGRSARPATAARPSTGGSRSKPAGTAPTVTRHPYLSIGFELRAGEQKARSAHVPIAPPS